MKQELEDHFQQAWTIYEESFPVDERRPWSSHMQTQLDPRYTFTPLLGENRIVVGVLGFWRFEEFTFIEHIAISSACKGVALDRLLLKSFRMQPTCL